MCAGGVDGGVDGRVAGLSGVGLLAVARAAVRAYAAEGGAAEGLAGLAGECVRLAGGETLGGAVGDERLLAGVAGWQRLGTMVHAETLRRVRALDERGVCQGRATSTARLLADRLGLGYGQARGIVSAAAALGRLPATAAAHAAGRLDSAHLPAVTRAVAGYQRQRLSRDDRDTAGSADPGAGGDGAAEEAALAVLDERLAQLADSGRGGSGDTNGEVASGGGIADGPLVPAGARPAAGGTPAPAVGVRETLEAWKGERPGLLAAREQRARRRRSLRLYRPAGDAHGIGVIHGELDPVTYAKTRTFLEALARRSSRDDARDHGQRMHDALGRLCDLAEQARGPDGRLPEVAGEPPRLLLVIDPAAQGGRLDGYGPASAQLAAQLGCDAETTTVARGPAGAVLDVGRDRRRPTRAQRRAVFARDQGCIGCGAPLSRCHIHHIRHWSHGGPTDVGNLAATCFDCHANIHRHDWRVYRRDDGRLLLLPPHHPPPTGAVLLPADAPPSATQWHTPSEASPQQDRHNSHIANTSNTGSTGGTGGTGNNTNGHHMPNEHGGINAHDAPNGYDREHCHRQEQLDLAAAVPVLTGPDGRSRPPPRSPP